MSSSSATTGSSSLVQSSDGSSVASMSDSYTTTSCSTVDPPSQLALKIGLSNQSTISAISDPSAASSVSHTVLHSNQVQSSISVFTPVLEESESAQDEASAFGSDGVNPAGTGDDSSNLRLKELPSNVRTSIDADGINIEINPRNHSPSPVSPDLPLECDYDTNPTDLYQAIECKDWNQVELLFANEPQRTQKQAATWVARKETHGKLRWRLLPIHAAVIFQSPAVIVEKLLHECPEAALAKDDQGMLPLHLAFRTKNTDWETIEELISSNPQAIFAQDRKGRTPLECGTAAARAAVAAANAAAKTDGPVEKSGSGVGLMRALTPNPKAPKVETSTSSGRDVAPEVQKAIFSVMELYSQISVQDRLQSAMNTSRQALQSRISAVQDSHIDTLTQLKKDWENQRSDLNHKLQGYRKEIQSLKSDFNLQQELLEEKVQTEMELVDRLRQVTTALEARTLMADDVVGKVARNISKIHNADLDKANQKNDALKRQNKELLLLLENLLDQQNSLKLSLDKLAWDTTTKNDERKELLNKYLLSDAESTELAQSYTLEWQSRLEGASQNVSARLQKILRDQNHVDIDDYDGEEKKEPHKSVVLQGSVASSSLSSSRQDP
jgi:hypothetical protein